MRETSDIDIRDAFFDEIYNIASRDKDVIFIASDTDAFSLRRYKKDFPEQFMNIGVAEQNLVSVAAGLALSGKKVFIYAIIPFITLRCYEHIKANLCSMNLPVTVIGIGAGLSFGYDGPTHHGICDIAVMRSLPEMVILNPSDSILAKACAQLAYQSNSPSYVRIDKGKFFKLYNNEDNFTDGLKIIEELSDVNIISTGFMTQQAVKVAEELKNQSINVGVVDLYRIKPINTDSLLKVAGRSRQLITLEENSISGGIGSIVSEFLSDNRKSVRLKRIALKDKQYFDYGTREWLHCRYGLDVSSITKAIKEGIN